MDGLDLPSRAPGLPCVDVRREKLLSLLDWPQCMSDKHPFYVSPEVYRVDRTRAAVIQSGHGREESDGGTGGDGVSLKDRQRQVGIVYMRRQI
jgi:hypothetical protein